MRKLIQFLVRFSDTFLFIALMIFAVYLIAKYNAYQKSVVISSSNQYVSSVMEVNSKLLDFFSQNSENIRLSEENVKLQNEVVRLKNLLEAAKTDTTELSYKITADREIDYIEAKVISNSTNKSLNYLTLNKGKLNGIYPDMGVINSDGVIGIVSKVTDHYASVISILNTKLQINSKFLHSEYSGPIVWDGIDSRYVKLNDIARHVKFALGDTLVSSGFTRAFPEGILIGTIDNFNILESDPYYNIKVKLAADFRSVSYVKVIRMKYAPEQKILESTNDKE